MNYYSVPGMPIKNRKHLSLDVIKQETARFFNLDVKQINSKARDREFVIARHHFFYYAHVVQRHTLKVVGEHTGNRDHTTVIHGVRTIQDLSQVSAESKELLNNFLQHMENIRYEKNIAA